MKNFLFIFLVMISIGRYESIAQDTTTICYGESLKLSASSVPTGINMQWFKDGVFVSDDEDYIVTEPGSYTLMCENTGGCQSLISEPLVVTRSTITSTNDSANASPGGTINIAILQNDESPCYPIDTTSLVVIDAPAHGTVVADGSGKFVYTAAPGFLGKDTFTYVIRDNNGNASAVTTVIINVADTDPLPIALAEFNVVKQGADALLTWVTTFTEQASHFEIERAPDGRTFTNIGEVAALENSSTQIDYSFTDYHTMTGKNFYRLKLVDLDGSFSYSPIKMLIFDLLSDIKIYPNPASDIVNIAMGKAYESIKEIAIIDVSGRIVVRNAVTNATEVINISSLASATYYVRLIGTDNSIKGNFKVSKTN